MRRILESRWFLHRVQDDTLTSAMYKIMSKSVEETVIFTGDDDTFVTLFGELVSFASVKHSWRWDDKPIRSGAQKDPNAMEVDALTKGGKSKSGKGKSVTCWMFSKTGHTSRDCFHNNKGKSKGKGKSSTS